jgi:selenide,water dikinase
VSPADLDIILNGLNFPTSDRTLVDRSDNDDSGVYKITDDIAIVQTVDIITPVVDDPYIYGQIAAANSLSDIYAMGAKVDTALNIVAYDNCHLTKEILHEILRGGIDKVREAGGVVLGGHTIEDIEMKYGLSVTGTVHPKRILRNNTIKSGDKIILTKPLGIGVITTSIKADEAPHSAIDKAVFHMKYLNKAASELAVEVGVNAMTDVTGFGLLGHLYEMVNNETSVELDFNSVPFIEESNKLAEMGFFPGGSLRNERYYQPFVKINNNSILPHKLTLMYDAQTSGGLLISVPKEKSNLLLDKLRSSGIEWAAIIGEVNDSAENNIVVG